MNYLHASHKDCINSLTTMNSSPNILKHNCQEGGDPATGELISHFTENNYHKYPSVAKEHIKRLKRGSASCDILDIIEEEGLESNDLNPHIFQDEEDYLLTENNMGINNVGLCKLEIKNAIEAKLTETCENYYDLWIPSNRTKQALAMKKPYPNFLISDLLTVPKICEEDLSDRLKQLATAIGEVGTTNFNIPYVDNVSQDENGLLELVEKETFRSAVNLTARLLMVHESSIGHITEPEIHSPQSIRLWFARLALLVKMKEFKIADIEATHWGDCDKPDLYYQFYPEIYGGRNGTMIPFQMRLLLADLPSHCGRHSESLNKLFSILGVVEKILKHLVREVASQLGLNISAKNLWDARKKCVLISILNVAIKLKDFILAIEILNGMIQNENNVAKKETLYSVLGLIHLQFGDLINAEKFFSMTETNICPESVNITMQYFQSVLNRGLLAVARNDYQEGYKYFEEASFIDSSSLMVMNNCAVCLFYLGHLREAIRLLTGAIHNNPSHALQDSLVLNLCTMYELDTSQSREKKLELVKLTGLFEGEWIDVSSFRLD